MKDMESCPVCGEGSLHPAQEEVEVEYKSEKHSVTLMSHICDECGSEIATSEDTKRNKDTVIALHQERDSRQ
ncbi:hypothetical protein G3577_07780 [Morganella morganii]|uniref:hypothetical protein n=1 Tax=Morganella morganii TaxID=582 RepID=UPI0013A718CD|nr:hypothetical protein [Morganella morganii]QIC11934.1 hypothetical protein G3577_07780 [Morganella morganii]